MTVSEITERSPLLVSRTVSLVSVTAKPNPSEPPHKLALESPDDALELVGNPGRFHYFQVFALCLQLALAFMADLIPIFYNLQPQSITCELELSLSESGVDSSSTLDYCHCNGTVSYNYLAEQSSIIGQVSNTLYMGKWRTVMLFFGYYYLMRIDCGEDNFSACNHGYFTI